MNFLKMITLDSLSNNRWGKSVLISNLKHYLCGATAFLNTLRILEKVQAAAKEKKSWN